MNNIADIVGFIRIHGDHLAQFRAEAVGGIVRGELGGVLFVVGGHEAEEFAREVETFVLALGGEVGDAALGGVGSGAAELLVRDDLTCYGADDIRAGDVHLADAVFHDDEIGDGRAVDRAAG